MSPARTTDDLPLPDGPITNSTRSRSSRATSSATSLSRPKNRSASSGWNAARPRYGQTRPRRRIGPGTEGPLELDVVLGIPPVAGESGDSHRVCKTLEPKGPAVDLRHAFHAASEVHDLLAGQDLTRTRERAEPRRQVQRTAPVAVIDPDGLARIESDPNRERQRRIGDRRPDERRLEVGCCPDRLAGRVEDGEHLVPAELEARSPTGLEGRVSDRREPGREGGRGLVAAFLRKRGVPANVGNQEDLKGRFAGVERRWGSQGPRPRLRGDRLRLDSRRAPHRSPHGRGRRP